MSECQNLRGLYFYLIQIETNGVKVMLILSIIAIIVLAGINIYTLNTNHKQSQDWQKERKDLYDRIMSKDLREYKDATEPVQIYKPVDNSEEAEWIKEQESKKV